MRYAETFPIAVEEELQVTDRDSGLLVSGGPAVIERARLLGIPHIKAETHKCAVEVTTGPCTDGIHLLKKLTDIRAKADEIGDTLGLRLSGGGCHRKSRWQDAELTRCHDTADLHGRLGEKLRRMLFFGLHVHVGIANRETAVSAAGRIAPHLPVLLGLSANSRYFSRRDTGYESYRARRLRTMPFFGTPRTFSDYSAYTAFVDGLVRKGKIKKPCEIRWDVRVHPVFETIEIRIMDCPLSLFDSAGLAILVRAMVMGACADQSAGVPSVGLCRAAIDEDRKSAEKYGMKAPLFCGGNKPRLPFELACEIIEKYGSLLTCEEYDFLKGRLARWER